MNLQKASRKKAKMKMAVLGPSGSGKTYSSLLLANGICDNWDKVAVIDTENNSADLYSHLGPYNTLSLAGPFSPERFIQAIEVCEKEDMEVIIIDSISLEWDFLLNYHASLQGNSFTNWGKITPRHNAFIQKLLQSNCHIICTTRTKQDFVLNEKNGRMIPEKVGLKPVQRDNLEYDFTIVFDLDIRNNAKISKDRTGLFSNNTEFKITTDTGRLIQSWCNNGTDIMPNDVSVRINESKSLNELFTLFKSYPQFKEVLRPEFEQRKREIVLSDQVKQELLNTSDIQNGISH